jgi:hypothetical protein
MALGIVPEILGLLEVAFCFLGLTKLFVNQLSVEVSFSFLRI